jgi:hypothetical protein
MNLTRDAGCWKLRQITADTTSVNFSTILFRSRVEAKFCGQQCADVEEVGR